jgi:hypothetical protein
MKWKFTCVALLVVALPFIIATVSDFDALEVVASRITAHDRSMYWGAGAMEVDGTECGVPIARDLVTGGPKPLTIACNASDSGTISGHTVMPDSWGTSTKTVVFEITLGQIAAATTVFDMDFEGQCVSSTESFVAFNGTGEQQATVTLTEDDDALQAETSPVTLNGTSCAKGDVLFWQGAIDASGSHTATSAQVVIVGVKMEYNATLGD